MILLVLMTLALAGCVAVIAAYWAVVTEAGKFNDATNKKLMEERVKGMGPKEEGI